MSEQKRFNIVPCSGIGKPLGSVSRLAAYFIHEDDFPDQTNLIPLALLVLGEDDSGSQIKSHASITLDGCQKQCAKKIVEEYGGQIASEMVVLDIYREHKQLKPQGIAELSEAGQQLARLVADKANAVICTALNSGKRGNDA